MLSLKVAICICRIYAPIRSCSWKRIEIKSVNISETLNNRLGLVMMIRINDCFALKSLAELPRTSSSCHGSVSRSNLPNTDGVIHRNSRKTYKCYRTHARNHRPIHHPSSSWSYITTSSNEFNQSLISPYRW